MGLTVSPETAQALYAEADKTHAELLDFSGRLERELSVNLRQCVVVTGYVCVPPGELTPGDAAAGREALLSAPYSSCGIPWKVFEVVSAQNTDEAITLSERPGNNAELPYNLTVAKSPAGREILRSLRQPRAPEPTNTTIAWRLHLMGESTVFSFFLSSMYLSIYLSTYPSTYPSIHPSK